MNNSGVNKISQQNLATTTRTDRDAYDAREQDRSDYYMKDSLYEYVDFEEEDKFNDVLSKAEKYNNTYNDEDGYSKDMPLSELTEDELKCLKDGIMTYNSNYPFLNDIFNEGATISVGSNGFTVNTDKGSYTFNNSRGLYKCDRIQLPEIASALKEYNLKLDGFDDMEIYYERKLGSDQPVGCNIVKDGNTYKFNVFRGDWAQPGLVLKEVRNNSTGVDKLPEISSNNLKSALKKGTDWNNFTYREKEELGNMIPQLKDHTDQIENVYYDAEENELEVGIYGGSLQFDGNLNDGFVPHLDVSQTKNDYINNNMAKGNDDRPAYNQGIVGNNSTPNNPE